MKKSSRRSFVKKLAGSALLAGAMPSVLLQDVQAQVIADRSDKKIAANDRIRIAAIGVGIMGFNNIEAALKIPGVELAAVCDLYQGRLTRAKERYGEEVFTTQDYQEVLDREDVDAVIVATSDHWHDRISIAAMNKGKAVYCEKPMVHKIEEGQAMIDTQKKTGKVLQVGSQRVSSILYQKAKEVYQSGAIGKLVLVETWYDRHSQLGAWQYSIPTDASEKTVDWERFQGDAPKRDFDKKRFFRWRNYQDYGTGVAGDLFVHLFSGLHVVTGSMGPERIFATGGLRYWKDGRDVPDIMIGSYDYPETPIHPAFNLQMRVNFVDGGGGGSMLRLVGTEGVMTIGWNNIQIKNHRLAETPGYGGWDSFSTFSEAQQKEYERWYNETYPKGQPEMISPSELEYRTPEGYSDHVDHWLSFVDAVRDGTEVIEDPSFGLRAAAPALATNMSYFENKVVLWDPLKMRIR